MTELWSRIKDYSILPVLLCGAVIAAKLLQRLGVPNFFVTPLIVDQYEFMTSQALPEKTRLAIITYINMLVGTMTCYLAISFILQTKDDFRYIVPNVEFSNQTKGARPILLDTSVLIDGRITDVAATGIMESQLVVPRFVLDELQTRADSGDNLKRNRGRRGLDVLGKLRQTKRADVVLYGLDLMPIDTASTTASAPVQTLETSLA